MLSLENLSPKRQTLYGFTTHVAVWVSTRISLIKSWLAAQRYCETWWHLCGFSGCFCASLQADRQYDIPPQHRLPKQPKDGFLVEQVFSPHPYPTSLKAHMKSNPLYTDMRLTELAEVKRGQPSWTIEEYARNSGDKGKLTALDLQVRLIVSGWEEPCHGLCGWLKSGHSLKPPTPWVLAAAFWKLINQRGEWSFCCCFKQGGLYLTDLFLSI